MQKGDLLVLGSDGIYDVVTDARIEECINKRDPKVIMNIFSFISRSIQKYRNFHGISFVCHRPRT